MVGYTLLMNESAPLPRSEHHPGRHFGRLDPDSVRLRRVEFADLPQLREHRNLESTRRWLENQSEIGEEEQLIWYQRGGAASIRIIEVNGQPMGIGRIAPEGEAGVQVGLDVFQAFRGQGLGKVFFAAVCTEAERQSFRLSLWVFAQNHPAVSIYRHAGFVDDPATLPRELPRSGPDFAENKLFTYLRMVRGQ